MADKHINIKLGTKYDGGGISSALRSLKKFVHGATDIKSAFSMVAGVVNRAFSGVKTIVGSAFRFETQTTQFKTLIGNIDEAKAHMADLKALGDTPPFNLEQFAAASRSLMVMTDGALGYKKSLEMIGDAAAATGMPIESMSHAVGRLFAVIRDGQPLSRATMQLRNMGILTPEVARNLDEMQKAGASASEMWAEVEKALAKYNGAMKATEQTGEGLVGAIKSRWDNIVRIFGQAFEEDAKGGMTDLLDVMKELEESGSIERWAASASSALASVVKGVKWVVDGVEKVWNHLKEGRQFWKDEAEAAGEEAFDLIREEQVNPYTKKRYYAGSDGGERVEEIVDEKLKRQYERQQKEEKKLADQKRREEEERARIEEALAEGQRKKEERDAKDAAEKRAEAEKKAAQDAAKERERLERELHQQRMADIRAEIKAQEEAASSLQATASAAQSEFERAFAMYRDPERAAAEIEEERSRAADLNRLHKDASRYGGKWRIDELSRLMASGDTQGASDTLAGWRKSRSFTPEVEAMVRASAAEKTKTTAEDELRKLNDQTADLTQKMEDLAKERDTRLDGIEHNTNQLANKIDELLSVKG